MKLSEFKPVVDMTTKTQRVEYLRRAVAAKERLYTRIVVAVCVLSAISSVTAIVLLHSIVS